MTRRTRKSEIGVFALLFVLLLCADAGARVQVGDTAPTMIETPHPYPNADGSPKVVWRHEFKHPGATFLKLHIAEMSVVGVVENGVPRGDYVAISDGQGVVREILAGARADGLWTRSLPGDIAVIELYADDADGAYGVRIDRYAYGTVALYPTENLQAEPESVCGTDERTPICEASTPARIRQADAVARLLYTDDCGGVYLCTGFLFAEDGRLLTNAHCANSASESASMEVWFNYASNTTSGGACSLQEQSNPDIYRSAGLLQANCELDVAVHRVVDPAKGNAADTYGFLSLADRLPAAGETIWIPQHPRGARKEISEVNALVYSAEVEGIDFCADPPRGCSNRGRDTGFATGLTYSADTEGGSSGSPVLDANNQVIGLHHAGGCTVAGGSNQGVMITDILPLLGEGADSTLKVDRVALALSSGKLVFKGRWQLAAGADHDPAKEPTTLTLRGGPQELFSGTLPAGSLAAAKSGAKWVFKDRNGQLTDGITYARLLSKDGLDFSLVLKAKDLDLGSLGGPTLQVDLAVGDDELSGQASPCQATTNRVVCR